LTGFPGFHPHMLPFRSFVAGSIAALCAVFALAEPALPNHANVSLVAGAPAELTVKRAKTGHLLVPAKINGREVGWFIFDTGAGMSCIAKPLATELGLPAAGETTADGNAGAQATTFRRAESFEFGPVRLDRTLLVELDLAAIAQALGEPIAGVIGYECFFAGVFEIDVTAPSISVRPTASFALPATERWHDFQLIGRRPHLAAQIEHQTSATFMLDLGSNEGVTLYSPTVQQLRLLEDRETTPSQHGGIGGMQPARKGTLRTFTLAGQTLADVPATFSQASSGLFASTAKAGAIGVRVLGKFRILIDYSGNRLALVPKP
jgi:hypothetical protein